MTGCPNWELFNQNSHLWGKSGKSRTIGSKKNREKANISIIKMHVFSQVSLGNNDF